MKQVIYLVLVATLFLESVQAQNLCTNGGFETCTVFPNNYAQICLSNGWLNPNGSCSLIPGTGSPDYYSTSGAGGAKAPTTWWASVMPHTGNGFAGFATWYSSANYREYLRTSLNAPLVAGNTYEITFWITNGISTLHYYGTNNIGFYFSNVPVTQTAGSPIIVTPQVETSTVIYSTTWQQVSFLYTPTNTFQELAIGNFHNDLATSRSLFGPNNPSSFGAYYYIDDISITLQAPLPVELISFTGVNKDQINKLSWTTASEVNNDHFDVEASGDGVYFTKIGVVQGNGNRTYSTEYFFDDNFPKQGLNYYRLRQVDYDGAVHFSNKIVIENNLTKFEIVSVKFSDEQLSGSATVYSSEECSVKIELFDVQGHLLLNSKQQIEKGLTKVDLDVMNLSKGFYLLKIDNGILSSVKRLVI